MTTQQATLPGAPEAPAANTQPRHRPWHYLLVTKSVEYADDDDFEGEAEYDTEGYDDLYRAREATDAEWLDHEAGVWDNWAGAWIVEPGWAGEVEMTAEGSAPYSARPAVADEKGAA